MAFGVRIRDMGERNVHGRWHVSVTYSAPTLPPQIDTVDTFDDLEEARAFARVVLDQGVEANPVEVGGE